MKPILNAEAQTMFSINCSGKLLMLDAPKIMGILNLTPDSFSDGGSYANEKSVLLRAEEMIDQGASIIDIGAQSTRPGAEFLGAKTEIERIGTMISMIKYRFPNVFISLDTFYAEVVNFGFNEGVDIINDISGGSFDAEMWNAVAHSELPYVLMHSNASYSEMHQKTENADILTEINYYFSEKLLALRGLGVKDIILDPGFGFGKTIAQQQEMIANAAFFGFGTNPVLAGISRKSFIYSPLGKGPADIIAETQKIHLELLAQGVKILRVHDVAETMKTLQVFQQGQY